MKSFGTPPLVVRGSLWLWCGRRDEGQQPEAGRPLQDSGPGAWGQDVETGLGEVSSLHSSRWHHFCTLHPEGRPLELC